MAQKKDKGGEDASKPRAGRIYGSTEVEPGLRDAIHIPVIVCSAAVPLNAGQRVIFIDDSTVHPAGVLRTGTCGYCYKRNVEIVVLNPNGGDEFCANCFPHRELDENDPYVDFRKEVSGHAIVDPFVTRIVEPGEYVHIWPLPDRVGPVRHHFDLTNVPQTGKLRLVSQDDEEWLNDSCRGCYD